LAPHLNPIERRWGVLRKWGTPNQYYNTFTEFTEANWGSSAKPSQTNRRLFGMLSLTFFVWYCLESSSLVGAKNMANFKLRPRSVMPDVADFVSNWFDYRICSDH
jgi:hypothetical protein